MPPGSADTVPRGLPPACREDDRRPADRGTSAPDGAAAWCPGAPEPEGPATHESCDIRTS